MEIEQGIDSYLSGLAAVTNLIGDRLYPVNLPQNPTYPALTYTQISEISIVAHDGAGDLMMCRFQFDCFALSYAGVKALARALRRALDGFKGTMGEVTVPAVLFITALDAFEDPPKVFRIPADFTIQWKE